MSAPRTLSPYTTFTADDYADLPDDQIPWIVQDLLPAGGSMLLYGPPKSKKTLHAQQLAYAIADPRFSDWLSFPVQQHGPVLYLQLDTARTIWKERVRVYKHVNKFSGAAVHIADKQITPFPFEIVNEDVSGWLHDTVARLKPIAVFVDVLRKATMLDENDSSQMMQVMNALESAIRPAALVMISHARKASASGDEGQVGSDNRGSVAIVGNVDSIIKVTKKTFTFMGRTVDESKLKLTWDKETLLFALDGKEFEGQMKKILADGSYNSMLARAHALSEISGRTLEACRTALRRVVKDASK